MARNHRLGFLVALLTISSAFPHDAAAKAVCDRYFSDLRQEKVKFCIDRSAAASLGAAENVPVVYFMHGAAGGTEQYSWIGYEKALAAIDAQKKAPPIAIVSFKTSALSFFSNWADGKNKHAYESWFLDEFIPFIEKKFPELCRSRECRGLLGVSMGGFGALKTSLLHPDKFAFAAATNPALLPDNIYLAYRDWDSYWMQTTFGTLFGRYFVHEMRTIFKSPEYYDANDPIQIAKRVDPRAELPKLYFDSAGHDEFGFQEGAEILRDELSDRKINFVYKHFPTAHHVVPHQPQSESAVQFLIDQIKR